MGKRGKSSRRHWIRIAAIAGVVAVLGVVAVWPGGWPRTAASALTQHRACFIPAPAEGQTSAVGFGDSITAGHTFPDLHIGANDSYFDTLACEPDSPISALSNLGVPGNTTDAMVQRLDAVVSTNADLVIVLGGTNDIRFGAPGDTIPNLETIRSRLEAEGIEAVFGLLPPSDLHPDETVKANEAIRAWAKDNAVFLIDLFSPLASATNTYRPGLSSDGIHPTPAGAKIMAEAAAAYLRSR